MNRYIGFFLYKPPAKRIYTVIVLFVSVRSDIDVKGLRGYFYPWLQSCNHILHHFYLALRVIHKDVLISWSTITKLTESWRLACRLMSSGRRLHEERSSAGQRASVGGMRSSRILRRQLLSEINACFANYETRQLHLTRLRSALPTRERGQRSDLVVRHFTSSSHSLHHNCYTIPLNPLLFLFTIFPAEPRSSTTTTHLSDQTTNGRFRCQLFRWLFRAFSFHLWRRMELAGLIAANSVSFHRNGQWL